MQLSVRSRPNNRQIDDVPIRKSVLPTSTIVTSSKYEQMSATTNTTISSFRESASNTIQKAASAIRQATSKEETARMIPPTSSLQENATSSFKKVTASAVEFVRTGSISSSSSAAASSASARKDVESAASQPILEELSELCPKLSYQQRVLGFFSCYAAGYFITFFSFGFFIRLVEGNPAPFVVIYSTGNILSLLSSTFLCGPSLQLKNMFHHHRKYTSIVYLCSIACTLIVCFIPLPGQTETKGAVLRLFLLVFLLLVQLGSSLWYTLSYLPFARAAVLKFIRDNFSE